MGDIPPGVVPYLVHPWVIANDKLKARGLDARAAPTRRRSAEALFALPPRRARSGAITAAVVLAALFAAVRIRRRRRTKRLASTPG